MATITQEQAEYPERSNEGALKFHAALIGFFFSVFLYLFYSFVSGFMTFWIPFVFTAVIYGLFNKAFFASIPENSTELVRDNFSGNITRVTGPKFVILLPWESRGTETKNVFNLEMRTTVLLASVQTGDSLRLESKGVFLWKPLATDIRTYNELGGEDAAVKAVTAFLGSAAKNYLSENCYSNSGKRLDSEQVIALEKKIRDGFDQFMSSPKMTAELRNLFGIGLERCYLEDVDYDAKSQSLLETKARELLGVSVDRLLNRGLIADAKKLLGANATMQEILDAMRVLFAGSSRAKQITMTGVDVNVRGLTPEVVDVVSKLAGNPAVVSMITTAAGTVASGIKTNSSK